MVFWRRRGYRSAASRTAGLCLRVLGLTATVGCSQSEHGPSGSRAPAIDAATGDAARPDPAPISRDDGSTAEIVLADSGQRRLAVTRIPGWSRSFPGLAGEDAMLARDGSIFLAGVALGPVDFDGGALVPVGADSGIPQPPPLVLARLAPDGSHGFSRLFELAGGRQRLVLGAAGEVVVATDCATGVDFGGGALSGDLCLVAFDATGAHLWSRATVGGFTLVDMAADSRGNFALVGRVSGSVDLGAGAIDAPPDRPVGILARFDAAGGVLWASLVEELTSDQTILAFDANDDLLIASERGAQIEGRDLWPGDAGVARLDALGQVIWNVGLTPATPLALAPLDTGLLIAGHFAGLVDFVGTPLESTHVHDAFVVRLDASDSVLWANAYGSVAPQAVRAAAAMPAGGAVLAVENRGLVDFGGGLHVRGSAPPRPDTVVVALDSAGQYLWGSQLSTNAAGGGVEARHVGAGPRGEVVVTGRVTGAADFGNGPLEAGYYVVSYPP